MGGRARSRLGHQRSPSCSGSTEPAPHLNEVAHSQQPYNQVPGGQEGSVQVESQITLLKALEKAEKESRFLFNLCLFPLLHPHLTFCCLGQPQVPSPPSCHQGDSDHSHLLRLLEGRTGNHRPTEQLYVRPHARTFTQAHVLIPASPALRATVSEYQLLGRLRLNPSLLLISCVVVGKFLTSLSLLYLPLKQRQQ